MVLSFVFIFAMFQTEEGYDITAIASTDIFSWLPVIISMIVGIGATVVIRNVAFKDKSEA